MNNNELTSSDGGEKISKFVRFAEFAEPAGVNLTPVSIEKVDGAPLKKKPEFCDAEGKVWVFTFIDHDHMDIERTFDQKYEGLYKTIKWQKIKNNQKYHVTYGDVSTPKYQGKGWIFKEI